MFRSNSNRGSKYFLRDYVTLAMAGANGDHFRNVLDTNSIFTARDEDMIF